VARLVLRPAVAETYIARVTVTVSSGPVGSAFTPIVVELARSGTQWIGRIPAIPAGAQRQFDAIAFDSSGQAIFAASATADIPAGEATVVSIMLDNRGQGGVINTFPVIDAISWSPDKPQPSATVQLHLTAHDPGGASTLSYAWLSTCGSFDNASLQAPIWTAPAQQGSCTLTITVANGRGATTGYDFTISVVATTGSGGVTATVNSWPTIDVLGGALSIWNGTMTGDLVVKASDADGDPLSYNWQSDCASILFDLKPPYGITTPHVTLPVASTPCTVTVAVFDGIAPRPTTGSLFLQPQVVRLNCQNIVCPQGQSCDPIDGSCKANGFPCTPVCGGKVCGPDGCSGSCGTCPGTQNCAATGQCVTTCAPVCTGRVCGADGCGGSCGTCTSGSCDAGTGQCVVTCTPNCTGKACGTDGCGGSCGTCVSGSCDATSGQCVVACTPNCTGKACGHDGCGGSCGTCTSGSCDATSGQCVVACTPNCTGKVCGNDGCGGSCGTCTSGSCDATSGQCVSLVTQVVPQAARDLPIPPPAALAMDSSGNTFVAGVLDRTATSNFQTAPTGPAINLQSQYGKDMFVARYDASGNIAWARDIGDDDPTALTDQDARGAALNNAGRLGIIGKITGNVTFGATIVSSASGIPYIAALSAADGSGLWGKGYDLGSNGLLARIASSPVGTTGRFAVCGQTNRAGVNPLTGTTYGGLLDAVIAVFDSAGNKLWAVQLATAGNELCNAVAMDDSGDVFAAGQFDGATLPFPGGTTLTGPGTTARKFMWLARFNGATGATLAAVSFSGPAGTILPQVATCDAAGNVFVGGNFSGAPVFGAATLTSAGSDDAFVARFDRVTLAPAVAPARIGGSGKDTVTGLAITSAGDVVATGTISPSSAAFKAGNGGFDTTGMAQLIVAGTTATDQLVVKLNGATLATDFAALYGDPNTQGGDSVVVNRFSAINQDAVTLAGTLTGTVSYGATAGSVTATAGLQDVSLVFAKVQ
jgi:hypothetical protein